MSLKKLVVFMCVFVYLPITWASNANWMQTIPNDRVFNQLMIPGTHDSGTYGIQPQSPFALTPDDPLPLWLETISNILPASIVRSIVARWSKTQPYSIIAQLNDGIRYLDFRVCYFKSHFYVCHALISIRLSGALQQIQTFIQQNPSEMIVVDLNHVYNVTDNAAQTQLAQLLQNKLRNIAIPNSYHVTDTMGTLRQSQRNVIIMMNTNQAIVNPSVEQFAVKYIWNESNINSPWPNAADIRDLKATLDSEMAFREKTYASDHQLFVLQTIQTENTNEVIDGILNPSQYPHSIKSFESPVNQLLCNWMNNYIAAYGPAPMNIVMQDWFTKESALVPLAIQYDSVTTPITNASVDQSKLRALKRWYLHL